jgi:hypothetical protein
MTTGSALLAMRSWQGRRILALFTPPEPTSTSMQVLDAELEEGSYSIALPAAVPFVASFLAVTVGSAVRTLTIGAMPQREYGRPAGQGVRAAAATRETGPGTTILRRH